MPTTVPAPLPLPSPNGFDVYMEAAKALVPSNPPVDAALDTTSRTPQQAQELYTPQRRHNWLVSNAAAWALCERAKQLPCRTPYTRGNASFPEWSKLRALAKAQSVRVKDAKFRGQWQEALDLGLDGLHMARRIEQGTVLIGTLVAVAMEFIVLRSLEDVPTHLDAAQAKAAARQLETLLDNAQPLSEVFIEEKWNILTALNGPDKHGSNFLSMFTSRPRYIQQYVDMADAFTAQADKPMGLRDPLPPRRRNMAQTFDAFRGTLFSHTRRETNERLFLLRLALRAYHLEHGSYPDHLGVLVPNYLNKIPLDPFGNGAPLLYRKHSDSYLAWSVGPDGVDSGGALIPQRPGQPFAHADIDSQGDIAVSPDAGAPL